ncbi:MAG TPA: choice-of-anchor tandem repeat GloVer-containing protein [Candidatus Acidoferrum sp.]|nr:choice-of-anchor tandem repeat GloVer-containing protein [Candidatus Acidoferrum sp.]
MLQEGFAANGYLYGMTQRGGPANDGTIFKISPAGGLTTLITFANTNGNAPSAGLLQANDGYFYGVTRLGGKYNLGTLFRLGGAPNSGPSLSLSLNNTNIIIQWTNNPANYTLQFTSGLPSTNWTTALPQPTLEGNVYGYTNYINGNSGFYRLIQPSGRIN